MDGFDLIARLRDSRGATLQKYWRSQDSLLAAPSDWRGKPGGMKLRLFALSEGDESRRVQIEQIVQSAGSLLSAAQLALIIAGETRGRLLGALIGLSEEQFDQAPADGEWSVRKTLGHVIATDQRYAIAVKFALERERSGVGGPLRPPNSALPAIDGEALAGGTLADVIGRLADVREAVARELTTVPDELLAAPTNWVQWDLDVRFRIHRFAAHDREHTIQVVRSLRAIGFAQSEAQMLLADAAASRGALEATVAAAPSRLFDSGSNPGQRIADLVNASVNEERDL